MSMSFQSRQCGTTWRFIRVNWDALVEARTSRVPHHVSAQSENGVFPGVGSALAPRRTLRSICCRWAAASLAVSKVAEWRTPRSSTHRAW